MCKNPIYFRNSLSMNLCMLHIYVSANKREERKMRVLLINATNIDGYRNDALHIAIIAWCYHSCSCSIIVFIRLWLCGYGACEITPIQPHLRIQMKTSLWRLTSPFFRRIKFQRERRKEKTKSNLTKVNYYFNVRVYRINGLCKRDDYIAGYSWHLNNLNKNIAAK